VSPFTVDFEVWRNPVPRWTLQFFSWCSFRDPELTYLVVIGGFRPGVDGRKAKTRDIISDLDLVLGIRGFTESYSKEHLSPVIDISRQSENVTNIAVRALVEGAS
jgi:hypothetical protein